MKQNVMVDVYTYKNETFDYSYYTSLKVIDKIKFVNYVIEILISDNIYHSTLKDLIFDYAIIKTFTDIDTSVIDKSTSMINKIEDFINETNIVEVVKDNVDYGVIEELYNSVEMNIEYRTGIHKNVIVESVESLLSTIENKINSVDTDGMMKAMNVLNSISGELTADKVVNAYANSDLFKERYNQIQAEKNGMK